MVIPAFLITGAAKGLQWALGAEPTAKASIYDMKQFADSDPINNPAWGDGGKISDEKDPDPGKIPRTATQIVEVYIPPKRVYDKPKDPTTFVIKLPPRRLLTEKNSKKATKTPIKPTITLEQAIKEREFGGLLWNPLTKEKVKIRQGVDREIDAELIESNKKGIKEFEAWATAQVDPVFANSEKYLKDYNFWAGTALVVAEKPRGNQGKIGLMYGLDSLYVLAAYYSALSLNVHIGITDTIPNGYKVTLAKVNQKRGQLGKEEKFEISSNTQILNALGVRDYPVIVPKDLTNIPVKNEKDKDIDHAELYRKVKDHIKKGDKLSEKLDKKEVEVYEVIPHATRFLSWQSKQHDALMGGFPIDMHIEDSDLIKAGDQGQDISLPNLAETLAEVMRFSITNDALLKAILSASLRNLMETGSTRVQSVTTYYLLEAIQEFIGFKSKQKSIDVNFTFNPLAGSSARNAESVSEALTETIQQIKVEEFDDKGTLEEKLNILLEAARITKGALWKKLDIKQMKDMYLAAQELLGNKTAKPGEESDWDKFIKDVELGYTDKTGVNDSQHPYGRDYRERPKVKDIGTPNA